MKKAALILITILSSLNIFGQDISGQWNGILNVQGKQLRVVFNISKTEKGYRATMDSPDQGAKGIPVTSISFENSILKLEITNATIEYEGTLNNENNFVGTFKQHGQPLPMNLSKDKETPKSLYQSPPYAKESMLVEMKLDIKTGKFILPGILTLPKSGDKFPVIILVHGSGPGDKDESVGANKPFKDLAYGLAGKGIAVLRYDKRTKVYGAESAEDINTLTVKEEVLDDVSSAVQLLKGIKEIDSQNIYVIGHSLGGELAPRITKLNPDLKGIVIMAGPARPMEDIILEQNIFALEQAGNPPEMKKEIDTLAMTLVKLKNNNFSDEKVKVFIKKSHVPESYWKDLNNYNQVEVAKNLDCKILILQGERDLQVSMKDFNIWKEVLANKKNAEFHSYPKLNHMFLEGEGKSSLAEYTTPGNVPEYVINDIVKWVGFKQ